MEDFLADKGLVPTQPDSSAKGTVEPGHLAKSWLAALVGMDYWHRLSEYWHRLSAFCKSCSPGTNQADCPPKTAQQAWWPAANLYYPTPEQTIAAPGSPSWLR